MNSNNQHPTSATNSTAMTAATSSLKSGKNGGSAGGGNTNNNPRQTVKKQPSHADNLNLIIGQISARGDS